MPIVAIDSVLIATVLEDISDGDALRLQEDLAERIVRGNVQGVLLDLSAVDTVDSFLGRLMIDIASGARLQGAQTIVVGIQPAVAITLVELGLELRGITTALTAQKGIAVLRRLLREEDPRAH